MFFGSGYLVGRAPNWGIAWTEPSVWTTCPLPRDCGRVARRRESNPQTCDHWGV